VLLAALYTVFRAPVNQTGTKVTGAAPQTVPRIVDLAGYGTASYTYLETPFNTFAAAGTMPHNVYAVHLPEVNRSVYTDSYSQTQPRVTGVGRSKIQRLRGS
jgi:hypothetical protein